jgi:hypothetical protein
VSASQPQTALAPITSTGEAEQVITHLQTIMDALVKTVEDETALVRKGRLRDATKLEAAKAELARQYTNDTERLVQSKKYLTKAMPEALEALRRRHETFHALLKINMTVLATAHAVSEGILRGVSSELAKKQAPSTYGKSGRPNAMPATASQPLAICRSL